MEGLNFEQSNLTPSIIQTSTNNTNVVSNEEQKTHTHKGNGVRTT